MLIWPGGLGGAGRLPTRTGGISTSRAASAFVPDDEPLDGESCVPGVLPDGKSCAADESGVVPEGESCTDEPGAFPDGESCAPDPPGVIPDGEPSCMLAAGPGVTPNDESCMREGESCAPDGEPAALPDDTSSDARATGCAGSP